jgi:hypothetical protein
MAPLKEWLDTHPLALVVGLAVSVGSAASGATAYLMGQVSAARQIAIETKYNQDKNEDKSTISDLSSRLSQIERRAGPNNQKMYLDVTSLQIPPQEARNLPAEYKAFDNGQFFVKAPVSNSWNFSILNEPDTMKLGPFKAVVELVESTVPKEFFSLKSYVWWPEHPADVTFKFSGEPVTGTLGATVALTKVTKQQIVEKLAALGAFQRKEQKTQEAQKKETGQALTEAVRVLSEVNADDKDDNKDKEANKELITTMEKLFDGDTAGFIFFDALASVFQMSLTNPNLSYSILSAQKHLNVMYLDLEISISDATIARSRDANCKNGDKTSVTLRREIFFVSYKEYGYLIKFEVPECDGRSTASDWVSQWFAGLKIVVKSTT